MHPNYPKAQALSSKIIGAAIEVHRHKDPVLIECIYENTSCVSSNCAGSLQSANWSFRLNTKASFFKTPYVWTFTPKAVSSSKTKS